MKRRRALDLEDKRAVLEKKAAKKAKKLEYGASLAEANRSRLAIQTAGTVSMEDVVRALGRPKSSKVSKRPQSAVNVGSLLQQLGVNSKSVEFAWSSSSEGGSVGSSVSEASWSDDEDASVSEETSDIEQTVDAYQDDMSDQSLDAEVSETESSSHDGADNTVSSIGGLHSRISFPASTEFTPESQDLLAHALQFEDVLLCAEQFHTNQSVPRSCYLTLTAHMLSHVLSRTRLVSKHNQKLKQKFGDKPVELEENSPFRDQGPTRPRVCLLCPFRANAYEIVKNIITLLDMDKDQIAEASNLESFLAEYEGQDARNESAKNWEPWRRELFKGHYDDSNYDEFVIGISFGHGKLKLHFPKTTEQLGNLDVIIGSPIGLSKIAMNDKKANKMRDKALKQKVEASKELVDEEDDKYYKSGNAETPKFADSTNNLSEETLAPPPVMDFLCSIEILVIDRIDALFMQNKANTMDIINCVNSHPVAGITADINRIHSRFLDPQTARAHRQTILIAGSVMDAEFKSSAILRENKLVCLPNSEPVYSGHPLAIALKQQIKQQFFIRLPSAVETSESDAPHSSTQLHYFKSKFWKDVGAETKGLVIVVSDVAGPTEFEELKSFLEDEGHVDCFLAESCLDEIAGKRRKQLKSILRAFRENDITCIVVTERLLWYQRIRISGGHHVLFYGPPRTDTIYCDILADMVNPSRCTSTCVYQNEDRLALERIVGSINVDKMIVSKGDSVPGKTTVFTPF